ncbi:MAG: SCO family protein [Bacteroidota bacterium]
MKYVFFGIFAFLLFACGNTPDGGKDFSNAEPLPVIGDKIPAFTFVNQDSSIITNATFDGKIYIADFFFTYCPTICPKMTKQMLRIYDKYGNDDRVLLLSHAIDTKRDTVGRLREYAENLGVTSDKWHFLTGDRDAIGEIADDYMSIVIEDPEAPGGFDHSGRIILVDKNRQIRSFADGTNPEEVNRFMRDMDILLKEMEEQQQDLTAK